MNRATIFGHRWHDRHLRLSHASVSASPEWSGSNYLSVALTSRLQAFRPATPQRRRFFPDRRLPSTASMPRCMRLIPRTRRAQSSARTRFDAICACSGSGRIAPTCEARRSSSIAAIQRSVMPGRSSSRTRIKAPRAYLVTSGSGMSGWGAEAPVSGSSTENILNPTTPRLHGTAKPCWHAMRHINSARGNYPQRVVHDLGVG